MRLAAAALLASLPLLFCPALQARAQEAPTPALLDRTHTSEEWANIAAHLPDKATASAATLETTGDVLRARRYQTDALDFYALAMARGGDGSVLLKKMGVVCLEMQQITLARVMFERAVRLHKKDASAWNDLGAAEFTLHDMRGAIGAYRRAIKYNKSSANNKSSAVFHSNLALAYFEVNDPESARHELAKALKLDPDLLRRSDEGGYVAQVLASKSYPEICFEMARIYASQGNIDAMLDWMAKASERGFDLRAAMDRDASLRPFLADERVRVILKNAQTLRAAAKAPHGVPPLGSAEH